MYQQESILVSNYFANCFANPNTPNDYDYLLSACFAEMTVEKGFAGVMYPSVRAEGQGFNVAIHPYFVDNCLELEAAGQCTYYKRGYNSYLDIDSVALLLKDQKLINFRPPLPEYHMGRNKIIQMLYPELFIN